MSVNTSPLAFIEGARLVGINLQHAPSSSVDHHRYVQNGDDAVVPQNP
jgi:hypothetical protein